MAPDRHARQIRRGAYAALGGAACFGAGTPIAKLLLPATGPVVLASLMYLGAGIALVLHGLARHAVGIDDRTEGVARRDVPLLLGMVLAGGVVGPVLMFVGLARVSAFTASLLLNLEVLFTVLLAVLLFGEHVGGRGAIAGLLVLAGAAVLGWEPGELGLDAIGCGAVAGACLAWALDTNLSQRLSLRDPIAVVRIKALGAGTCTAAIALAAGETFPGAGAVAAALALGGVSYGVSLVLVMHALRILGAAREAAYFATAPFIGAVVAIAMLGDRPDVADLAAAATMAIGVVLLLRERHDHVHTHEPMEHDHLHTHDDHHLHHHEGPVVEPHGHLHRHDRMTHAHAHGSDLHHRHRH